MQVILLEDVEKLGLRGDVVDVARGYARNYLLPRSLAEAATPGRIEQARRRDEQRARQEARTLDEGRQVADVLSKTVLRFEVKAGPTGALFGSVTPSEIADAVWRTRKIRVDRRKIDLREPIKRVGRYEVAIDVFPDVRVEVKTLVVPEGGELPPDEELEAWAAEEAAEQAAEGPAAGGAESAVLELEDAPDAGDAAFGDDEALDAVEGATPEFLDPSSDTTFGETTADAPR